MVSVSYPLNKSMDFYQTCIDTLLGGEDELVRLQTLCRFRLKDLSIDEMVGA